MLIDDGTRIQVDAVVKVWPRSAERFFVHVGIGPPDDDSQEGTMLELTADQAVEFGVSLMAAAQQIHAKVRESEP